MNDHSTKKQQRQHMELFNIVFSLYKLNAMRPRGQLEEVKAGTKFVISIFHPNKLTSLRDMFVLDFIAVNSYNYYFKITLPYLKLNIY